MATNNSINLQAAGIVAYSGTGTFYGRTLTAGSSKISISNGDGTGGNPTIDATEANFTLDNIGGTLSVSKGGTGNTTFTAYSVICAGTTATGAFQNVSGLGTSGYVLTSQGAGALPQWAAPASETYVTVTGASQAMAVNTVYIANRGTAITFSLPTTAAVGQFVEVVGLGAGLSTIGWTTNQLVHFGNVDATTTTGTLVANNRYDCIKLRCVVANLEFDVVSCQGNWTYT